MTSLALARGVVVELYPDAQPALVIPHLNCRLPIARFDAAVLCSLVSDPAAPAGSASAISADIFTFLAGSGTLAHPPPVDEPANGARSLTLSDWAVLHACQYAPPSPDDTTTLLQIRDRAWTDDLPIAPLPEPTAPPAISLWDAISRRRSARGGPVRDLSLARLSALFANVSRTAATTPGEYGPIYYRPAASAGARHPIDIYVVSVRAESLDQGIYYYDPQGHTLQARVISSALVMRLVPLLCRALTSDSTCLPALVLLFDLVVDRTGEKYGAAAGGLILRDLGCMLQQLHLVITGLDLVGCAIGRLPGELMERVLRLDLDRHIVLGGFAVW